LPGGYFVFNGNLDVKTRFADQGGAGVGVPTGEYEDFVTGFVIDDALVWGRPVGIAQAREGSLLFSEDGNSTIWRVTIADRTLIH
jgi:glucose/arabinose dehydrogenase